MARALMGHIGVVGSSNEHVLAHEVMRLRRRVTELEAELETLRAEGEHALSVEGAHTLDLELHQLAGAAEPALA